METKEIDGILLNMAFINSVPWAQEVFEKKEFEGVPFKVVAYGKDLEPGDTYFAWSNSGLKLLTCKENNKEQGWIVPVENAYSFDTHKCLKIELLID